MNNQTMHDEVFHDGLTTFWMIADGRRPVDAVIEAARLEGPFESYISVQLVSGRVEQTSDGPRFYPDPDSDLEFWEVDAQ